ncbi:MAG: hypothetical protein ACW963_05365 [Candidatus Sifarchaeia archaeon]|jgi:hypothetical protein
MKRNKNEIGVGATEELSMRVSVGTLIKVLFENPETGRQMLALERTATLREIEGRPEVGVKANPFGGGVKLTNSKKLKDLMGNFHYDSERSYQEGDFRIQINPVSWEKVKEICKQHLKETESRILDSSPERELVEEFEDSLKIKITSNQYILKQQDLIVEDLLNETDNVYAEGLPTVRIYYLFEARIKSPEIIKIILANSNKYSNNNLQEMAIDDAKRGGKGRANAILTLDLDEVKNIYNSIPLERRSEPVHVGEHQLDGNVPAVLEEINHPKYQHYTC